MARRAVGWANLDHGLFPVRGILAHNPRSELALKERAWFSRQQPSRTKSRQGRTSPDLYCPATYPFSVATVIVNILLPPPLGWSVTHTRNGYPLSIADGI
jgi:hypothetical protein